MTNRFCSGDSPPKIGLNLCHRTPRIVDAVQPLQDQQTSCRSQCCAAADLRSIEHKLDVLTRAVHAVVKTEGLRLTRTDVARRLGITTKTLRAMVARGDWPPPGAGGKWLLEDVLETEAGRL
jgi:hypothetical protein